MKVEDIIDESGEFKLSAKSKEADIELSAECIDGVIIHCDITLIKSSMEEISL